MQRADGEGIGVQLRVLRIAAGLSQERLALRAGVSPKTVRSLEAGTATGRPATLGRLFDALGLSPTERWSLLAEGAARAEPGANGGPSAAPGTLLRIARQERGWTQRQLAREASIHYRTVSDLERGVADRAQPATALGLGRALGLDGPALAAFVSRMAGAPSDLAGTSDDDGGLVGRQREVGEVISALHKAGVVALVGPAGVGKTALATAVAKRYRSPCIAHLASYQPGTALVDALSSALSVDTADMDGLSGALAGVDLLLLDNLEHLADIEAGLAELRSRLACRLLVTSRRRTGPPTQMTIEVGPLTPTAAVELLLCRVPQDHRDAGWSKSSPALEEICYHLDYLPLAIELAAHWSRLLDPDALLRRLSKEEVTGSPVRVPLDGAMRAAVLRSVSLLTTPAASLFGELSLHPVSWTVDFAEAVHGGHGLLPLLDELIDLGLVLVDHSSTGVRLRLLAVVREVAAELELSEARRRDIQIRRLEWAQEVVRSAADGLVAGDQAIWLSLIDREREHIYAALDQAVESHSPVAVTITAGLWRYWNIRGHYHTGAQRITVALTNAPENTPAGEFATGLYGRAVLAYLSGDIDSAVVDGQEAFDRYSAIGDTHGQGSTCSLLGMIQQYRSDHAGAEWWYRRGLDLVAGTSSQRAEATLLGNYGTLLSAVGRQAEAADLVEEAKARFEVLGDRRAVADMGSTLAALAVGQGDPARAERLAGASRASFAALGDPQGVLDCLLIEIQAALDGGRIELALRWAVEARHVLADHDDPWGASLLTAFESEAQFQVGDLDEAFRRARQSQSWAGRLGYSRARARAALVESLVWLRRGAHGRVLRAATLALEESDLESPQQLVAAVLVLVEVAGHVRSEEQGPVLELRSMALDALASLPGETTALLASLAQNWQLEPGLPGRSRIEALRTRGLELASGLQASGIGGAA